MKRCAMPILTTPNWLKKVHGMNAANGMLSCLCQAFWANSTKLNDVLQKLGNKEIK